MGGGIDAEGLHVVLCVAAAPEEDERMATIEEGCSEVVLGGAVPVAVAPVVGIAAGQWIGHPQGPVCAYGVRFAGCALEIEQILGTRVGIGHVGRLSDGVACVDVHVADVLRRAVGIVNDHVVGTTHEHFSLPVAVPVVAHGIVLLVRTAHHVRSEVDVPQALALDRVALDVIVGRVVGYGTAVGRIVALDQELRDAIAIDVGQRDVVDVVVVGDVGATTRVDGLHGKLDVLLVKAHHRCTLLLFNTIDDGSHLILRAAPAGRVEIAGHTEGLVVHLGSIAIEVELSAVVLFAEESPADEAATTRLGRNGHKTSVKNVGRTLCAYAQRAQEHKHCHEDFFHFQVICLVV